jgi:hypothetical protein
LDLGAEIGVIVNKEDGTEEVTKRISLYLKSTEIAGRLLSPNKQVIQLKNQFEPDYFDLLRTVVVTPASGR